MREEIMNWINCLPDGWVSRFGEELCDELLFALGRYANDFIIDQVKEKYGEMRMYWHWREMEYPIQIADQLLEVSAVINDIIEAYTEFSRETCMICGAHAQHIYIRNGWLEPLCDNCCN